MNAVSWKDPTALNRGWEDAYRNAAAATMWQDDPVPLVVDAIEELRTRKARTVVDVGCGDGRNVAALAASGFSCTGVDVSPTALAGAARRTAERGLARAARKLML